MKARAGGGTEEARYAAQRKFGNTLALREASREMWGWGAIDRLWQDLRYGLRMLANNPSFTLIAVLTLAVGIGVNTAIFTAFNAVALRPLDVPEPERVVQIDRSQQAGFFSYPGLPVFPRQQQGLLGHDRHQLLCVLHDRRARMRLRAPGWNCRRGGIRLSASL